MSAANASAVAATAGTAAAAASAAIPLLLLGVFVNERRVAWRTRLRLFYAPTVATGRVAVKYIFDEQHLRAHAHRAGDDEVGVPIGPGRRLHCAHKMVGWWKAASRWPAEFYAKTDDDAVIDLPRLLPVLEAMPRRGVYGGIARYSSINDTTLEGECWGLGAVGALSRKASGCPRAFGPFPFVEGPLVVLSADVQAWAEPRLARDARQRCHFEDLLLGRALAAHPAIALTNLDSLVGNPNVADNRGAWIGAGVGGLLAHWTRSDEAFDRAVADFQRAAASDGVCSVAWKGGGSTGPCKRSPSMQLACRPWQSLFPRLGEYPCCGKWTLCVPDAGRSARTWPGRGDGLPPRRKQHQQVAARRRGRGRGAGRWRRSPDVMESERGTGERARTNH